MYDIGVGAVTIATPNGNAQGRTTDSSGLGFRLKSAIGMERTGNYKYYYTEDCGIYHISLKKYCNNLFTTEDLL